MNFHTDRVYKHTGYDISSYFRSSVILKKNVASTGFGSNFFRPV